ALAHNGNLINALELHDELLERGVTFSSTSDSEIIAALIATHPADEVEEAIADVVPRLRGAFSMVVMTKDRVVAIRDPHGLRPLALGTLAPAPLRRRDAARYCVASESCAFDIIGAELLREVEPGEIVPMLRDAGAAEVHMRISAPPIKHPCHYGIDMSTREEMIAHGRSTAQIAAELGCDSLHYLSMEGVYEAVGASRATHCDACFT